MGLFERKKGLWEYEVQREGEDVTLRINTEDYLKVPSIEDDPVTMAKACEKLIEVNNATKIIFSQKRDYEYDFNQTTLLAEIARLYNFFVKQKAAFSLEALGFNNSRYNEIQVIFKTILTDPLGAFVKLRRLIRMQKIELEKTIEEAQQQDIQKYINILTHIMNELNKTRLITIAKPYLSGFRIGDREIYRRIFRPSIKPDFMFTKLMSSYPSDGIEIGP